MAGDRSLLTVRISQAVMMFFCVVSAYMMRTNISVGIVAMTTNSTTSDFPVLPWDTRTKTMIFSSYFWGYMMLQIPAGMFAQMYGPKKLLLFVMTTSGLLTIATPYIAINMSWKFVAMSRVAQGISQGCLFPSFYALLSKWAPPQERNLFLAFVFSGTQLGTIVTLFFAGILAASSGGWPSIFYLTGSCSILWALLWAYVGANSPEEHRFISKEERDFIESSLAQSTTSNKKMKVPWSKICKSVPMWALLITHFCENWGFWTLISLIPSYLSSAYNVEIKNNGIISSLPYILNFTLTMGLSRVADCIIGRKLMSKSAAKKMWNTIGFWGPAGGLIILTMSETTRMAIIMLTLSIAMNFGVFFGFFSNHLDLGPNFAGVLMGLTNCLSNSASFIAPLVAGFILQDESDLSQWNTVYYITAFVMFIGNAIFLVFGTAEVQPWNEPEKSPDDQEADVPLKTIGEEKFAENGIVESQNIENC